MAKIGPDEVEGFGSGRRLTKMRRKRLLVLLLAAGVLPAIVLLSSGLPGRRFQPGQRFTLAGGESAAPRQENPVLDVLPMELVGTSVSALVVLLLILVPVSIIALILSPDLRKWLLKRLGPALVLVAILLLLYVRPTEVPPAEETPVVDVLPQPGGTQPPLAVFEPNPPSWLRWATGLGLAALVTAVVAAVAWGVWYLARRRRQATSAQQLAQTAQSAIDALQGGADLKNTVLRCYFEMSRVLDQERGLHRGEAMTPREFEARLSAMDLPQGPIGQLTRLFEGVRYGSKPSGEADERDAIACLKSIVEACRQQP